MNKELKEYYFINGYTKSGKFVTIFACTTPEMCIDFFKQKYPRFSGKAKLFTEKCMSWNNGIANMVSTCGGERKIIKEFTKNSELIAV
jgi:hypothetical protein